jgi:hypothetical protein
LLFAGSIRKAPVVLRHNRRSCAIAADRQDWDTEPDERALHIIFDGLRAQVTPEQ